MRYRFIDAIVAVDAHGAGTIRTAKAFARSEEYLEGTFRRAGEVPASLVLESMAAAGSLLLAVRSRWRAHGVLLKVARAGFFRAAGAGDRLTIDAAIRDLQGDWDGEPSAPGFGMAQVAATAAVGGARVAEADFLFVGVPMRWSFGRRHEQVVAELLELIGRADARP